jgi:branched-chain amino acid transport system substrate-binding protein
MFKKMAVSIFAFMMLGLTSGDVQAAEKPYKIGALLPLTGNASFIGEYVKNGIELATEEINAGGGINGTKIEMLYEDTKNDPKEGVSIVNKLTSIEKVPVVISAMTGVTNAIIPIADRNNTVVFATTVSASGVTEQSQNVFRLFITADIDASTMAKFAAVSLKLKKIAIIHVNDDFGLSFAKVFTSIFQGKDRKVIFTEGYDKGTSDYRTLLLKLKKASPDAVYLLGYDNNLGIIPKQLRELDITMPILSIGTIAQPNVLLQAGNALNVTYFTTTEFSADNPMNEASKKFIENYRKKYGKAPNYFSAFAYDSVKLIANAIKIKGYSPEGVRSGLLGIKDFKGTTGSITIKSNRDADFKMVVKKIEDGKVTDAK